MKIDNLYKGFEVELFTGLQIHISAYQMILKKPF